MHWVAIAWMLAAQEEAERLDLIDLFDEVDPVTRERIDRALDREDELFDLPILIEDLALEPRTRDGSISVFASFAYERFPPERSASWFFIGLAIDFDELIIAPEPYGSPPEEQHRIERCREIVRAPLDPIGRAESMARFAALECGGGRL